VIEAGSEDEALAQEDGNPQIGFDRVPLDLDKQSHARGQLNKLLARPAIAWRRKQSSAGAVRSLLLSSGVGVCCVRTETPPFTREQQSGRASDA